MLSLSYYQPSYFKKISKYQEEEIPAPMRKTRFSAGQDMAAAEDVVVPSYRKLLGVNAGDVDTPVTLATAATLIKENGFKPTLIPTGYKCKLPDNYYLELSIRSSSPLKYWLILANGVGIIDADYQDNPDNEGHIFFQVINLSPYDIQIKKGDIIGQAIIKTYSVLDNDLVGGTREGGFGSTS